MNALYLQSHPVRDAWVEIAILQAYNINQSKSHPVRDAWVEIAYISRVVEAVEVASREGCVG